MAFFNQSHKPTNVATDITTIATGALFTGKINLECGLHIDGEVNGDIVSSGTVKIGRSGRVTGTIVAHGLVVSGKFHGQADCESIEIISGGDIEAKLESVSLSIDSNSRFEGEIIRKQADDTAKVVNISGEESALEKALGEGKA